MGRLQKYIKRKWANISFVKEVEIKLGAPIVSFTFDDSPASSFDNGGQILSKYGFPATYYVSLSLLDAPVVEGGFQANNLLQAVNNKHELACHTYGHIELSNTPQHHIKADIKQNQKAIYKILPNLKIKNFSYPFGEQTKEAKQYFSTKFRSARGISDGINAGRTDLLNLKACKLYENRMPLMSIFSKIDEACKCNGWLIFYTHDVAEPYSDFGCSPQFLEAIADEIARREISVLTINDALNKIEKNYR